MKHILIASVLVVVVAVLVILGLRAADLVPQLASEEGKLVDQLFQWQMYVIAFIFALIVVFVLYAVVVFRRRPGETEEGRYVKGHVPLEIAWTVIPLIIVMGFGVVSAQQLSSMTADVPDELVVEVTGFQFGWRFDYPEAGVSSQDLVLPVGRKTLLKITSTDVIHSFWVPEFRVKQDAVPGRWTELRVTPTEVGDYRIRCAEMCGYAHSVMYAPVQVVGAEDFAGWLAGKALESRPAADMTPEEKGAAVADATGCMGCHSVDGSESVGPTWLGLFGSEVQLEDGSTVTADEAYVRDSILDPESQIVAGYPKLMPPAYSTLEEGDIEALIAYIKSLGQ